VRAGKGLKKVSGKGMCQSHDRAQDWGRARGQGRRKGRAKKRAGRGPGAGARARKRVGLFGNGQGKSRGGNGGQRGKEGGWGEAGRGILPGPTVQARTASHHKPSHGTCVPTI